MTATRLHRFTTREEWLTAAATALTPRVEAAAERKLPPVQAIVSWPRAGKGISRGTIGQCFAPGWTRAGTAYVTVSPVLGDDVPRLLDVVLHELVHAVGEFNHGRGFSRIAEKLGLVKPWTATTASELLREDLIRVAAELGPYPHIQMFDAPDLSRRDPGDPDRPYVPGTPKDEPKRELWPYCVSPVEPSYKVKISPRLLADYGPPACPISGEPMIVRRSAREK